MAVYEYNCPVHGVIERWVKFGEEEPSRCPVMSNGEDGPDCGEPLKKLLSRGTFWFADKRKH